MDTFTCHKILVFFGNYFQYLEMFYDGSRAHGKMVYGPGSVFTKECELYRQKILVSIGSIMEPL